MLNRMFVSVYQRNSGKDVLSENTYAKRTKTPTMRMTIYPSVNNNYAIRNSDNAQGITDISMREILGMPKKNCSSCRGG